MKFNFRYVIKAIKAKICTQMQAGVGCAVICMQKLTFLVAQNLDFRNIKLPTTLTHTAQSLLTRDELKARFFHLKICIICILCA